MVADGESHASGFYDPPPAFDAALDVLGDWGSDGDWLLRLPSPPSSPALRKASSPQRDEPPTKCATSYRRKRDARDATRQQLEQQVAQLTRQLESERQRFPEREQPLTGDALALSREWASMATRQRRQRHAAEQHHDALMRKYRSQCRTMREMGRLVEKAVRIARMLGPTSETVTIADYSGPTLDVATHLTYLKALHNVARAVTESKAFARPNHEPFREVRVRTTALQGVEVEFVAEWVLPFSVPRVVDAVWDETTRMEHEGRRVDYLHSVATASALVSSFISAPDATDMPGSNHGQAITGRTHGQTALCRFDPSADGSVWVLAMNHARILDKSGETEGFMKGDGWIHVEPNATRNTVHPRELSRIKWCHRMTGWPVGYERMSPDERARWAYAAVTGPMRAQWERNFERTLQTVENALVLGGIQRE